MILVVNMIPNAQSGETHQDSEPNVSFNPANTQQLAGSAFTPAAAGGANAPLYVSSNGGHTWSLNAIVPGGNTFAGTADITERFSRTNHLYVGTLRGDTLAFNVDRTANFLANTPMQVLESRGREDQPWTQAITVPSGPDAGKDRVYIGINDFNAPGGKTATIEQCLDAAAASPAFSSVRIEKRATAGQNGPQVRPTVHPDGTIYAVFYGWRSFNSGLVTADVVVVRDDGWGAGTNPYTALVDPGDHVAGLRVAQNVQFTWFAPLGQQRTGGDLAIVVDPRNSANVYLVWADHQTAGYTLHLRHSTNRGASWGGDVLTITNATNPGLAINSSGEVGFLYQQVTGPPTAPRWETHLRRSYDGVNWTDLVLATTPASTPSPQFQPYIGDYIYLTASQREFLGVFCANNTPDRANFPSGVVYQRNANFTTHTLLNTDNHTPVAVSIDPFFFRVSATRALGSADRDLGGYAWPESGTQHVMYRGEDNHVHELWWSGAWHHNDLSASVPTAPQPSAGTYMAGYAWAETGTQHLIYLADDHHVHELWWAGAWAQNDLTVATGAPAASAGSALTAYVWAETGTQHVIYLADDHHVHELWYDGGWHHNDLTAATAAPLAAEGGALAAYAWPETGTQHTIYLGNDHHVHELWWDGAWHHNDLTAATGAPICAANSALTGYEWSDTNTQHVIYRADDHHVHELWWDGAWHHNDLSAATGAPICAANSHLSGWAWPETGTQHVIYVGNDHHVHELWYAGAWHHNDLTTASQGAPPAAEGSSLSSYVWAETITQHVIFLGNDHHVHELWWGGNWAHNDLTAATGAPLAEL